VEGFDVGEKITIDTGADLETAVIATVGTAGGTTAGTATDVGAIVIPVASAIGFRDDQTITIDDGANSETAVVASVRRFGPSTITVTAPLTHAHAAGAQVSGTGITLIAALTRAHAAGAQVSDNVPTPGAPNLQADAGEIYSFDPPSTGMLAPVIHRAPSEARNTITAATSSGLSRAQNQLVTHRKLWDGLRFRTVYRQSGSNDPSGPAGVKLPYCRQSGHNWRT
jgi:hypothetical protein